MSEQVTLHCRHCNRTWEAPLRHSGPYYCCGDYPEFVRRGDVVVLSDPWDEMSIHEIEDALDDRENVERWKKRRGGGSG
jgi:hypothetical protein